MADKETTHMESGIPDELRDQAQSLIGQAFHFFRDHFGRLSRDLNTMDAEYNAAKKRIKRGARRTDGRIV